MSFSLTLLVGNLPSNRLALTNKIYISNDNAFKMGQFFASKGIDPIGGSGSTKGYLLLVNGQYPYCVEGHNEVPDDQVAFNGLQRRFAKLSLSSPITLTPYIPYPPIPLQELELKLDTLAKVKGPLPKGTRPKEIDTDKLCETCFIILEGQVVQVGQNFAIDFEGTKYELTVSDKISTLDDLNNTDSNSKKKSSSSKSSKSQPSSSQQQQQYSNMGQVLEPTLITFTKLEGSTAPIALIGSHISEGSAGGGGANSIFLADFDFEKLGIGGLDAEFNKIFRRAFASRIWPAHIIQQMGIKHVRGMLLYGPPGCGKTLIARQIGKALNSREPKIVNGPEILNKYVGGSEEKIRELFADAEKEQLESGDSSMLHIVILDEMDAICKQRGSTGDSTGVSDSVVNQLLSKIDGVDSLNNILLIGMTNRKDMIDDALLRPGRLEVHVEIGLPDFDGRLQILGIHTRNMKKAGRVTDEVLDKLPDIAEKCKNFSGAEIEGLVKAASSYALTRCVDVKDLKKAPDTKNLMLQYNDFERALLDVEPKFGAKSTEFKALYRNGFVNYGESFDTIMNTLTRLVEQVRSSTKTPLMTVLLQGSAAVGKTAIAAKLAVDSGFPFVRMISADEMIGYTESSKSQRIHRVFMDSYKSPLSIILIDDIERIIDYVPIGPRFSNTVLQTLLVLLKKVPPDDNRKLLIIGTTSIPHLLEDLGIVQAFGIIQSIPLLDESNQIMKVLMNSANMNERDAHAVATTVLHSKPIGIKQLLMVAEMAIQATISNGGNSMDPPSSSSRSKKSSSSSSTNRVDVNIFLECLTTVGL